MANGTVASAREVAQLGGRLGLSASSASWYNLGQMHERKYVDEKRTKTEPCLYLTE